MDFERDTPPCTEDGESFLGEDEEHIVHNFMLCSLAHFVCCPFLQAFLHEEETCKVTVKGIFSLAVLFFCQN